MISAIIPETIINRIAISSHRSWSDRTGGLSPELRRDLKRIGVQWRGWPRELALTNTSKNHHHRSELRVAARRALIDPLSPEAWAFDRGHTGTGCYIPGPETADQLRRAEHRSELTRTGNHLPPY